MTYLLVASPLPPPPSITLSSYVTFFESFKYAFIAFHPRVARASLLPRTNVATSFPRSSNRHASTKMLLRRKSIVIAFRCTFAATNATGQRIDRARSGRKKSGSFDTMAVMKRCAARSRTKINLFGSLSFSSAYFRLNQLSDF